MGVTRILRLQRLVDGDHGAGSALLRGLLAPAGLLFGFVAWLRVKSYRGGWHLTHRPPVPVVSVGNLTAGGTGKTPFVRMLAGMLRTLGHRPAILLRGYGARNPEDADEVRLYRMLAPEIPLYPGRDRTLGAQQAVRDGADVLLLDDGFQHLRLERDLDIVLVDATAPFGGGLPLPAGLLREFSSALNRAHLVVLTRTDQIKPEARARLDQALAARVASLPVLESVHQPARLATLDGTPQELESLAGQRVVALSAIGRPMAFAETLGSLGATLCEQMVFPDHYPYTENDMMAVRAAATRHKALVVTTEKDAVKLRAVAVPGEPVRVLGVDLRLRDETPLREMLTILLATAPVAYPAPPRAGGRA